MEKGSLGKTRKYKNGSIHENASGKFMIVDRYMGEDNKPWLTFQWLSGASEGKTETNKEENINASLYKFKVSRGLREPIELKEEEIVTPKDNYDILVDLAEKVDFITENESDTVEKIEKLENMITEQSKMIEQLSMIVKNEMSDKALIQKLIEKM